ncbi:MAG TPA: MarR family transcriptional regulator [Solirubrobacteraceae bacterium]|jgi:DNA-binding MarR family transcriptional regulator
MSRTDHQPGTDGPGEPSASDAPRVGLGRALRQAWVGYQRRLDQELAAAGFGDRRFPDGRALRICSRAGEPTISQIGRELEITRQGAAKIVARLRDRGYLTVSPSATNGREKTVKLTRRATDYLEAHRTAARRIEAELAAEVGADSFEGLSRLLAALGGQEQPGMYDYLRRLADLSSLRGPED